MDPAHAHRLVELGFDFVMGQKVSRFVAPERVLAVLDAVLVPPLIERVVTRHLVPLIERERARMAAPERHDKVADALTEPALDALRELAGTPVMLDKAFLRRVVEQDAVRLLIRSITEDTINQFLRSFRGKGAMGLASSMGKALFDKAAPMFMDSSLSLILAHVVDTMAAPDSAQRMADMASLGLEGALEMRVRDVAKASAKAPWPQIEQLLDALPGLLAHNLARPETRAAILAEVGHWVSELGELSVGELLAEARVPLRAQAVTAIAPLIGEVMASEAFRAWLAHG